jgi:hypothetical protein
MPPRTRRPPDTSRLNGLPHDQWHQGFGQIRRGPFWVIPFRTEATCRRIAEQAVTNVNASRKRIARKASPNKKTIEYETITTKVMPLGDIGWGYRAVKGPTRTEVKP